MTQEEKDRVQAAIVEKMKELAFRIQDLKESTKPMGLDNAVGRLSRMDYINNKSIDEASLRTSESKLNALKRWLDLIDTEKFGKCSKCGQEININRLLFLPESTRCIKCAGR